jgi:Xaa-Pro aminopeptidase
VSYRIKPNMRDFDPLVEDEPDAAAWNRWPRRDGADLTPLEERWETLADDYAERHTATPAYGLKRALKEAGLEKGCIGVDDARIVHWMNEMGLPGLRGVDATNIFREIRMIKSDEEIELLRKAGAMNEAACNAAISIVREGTTWEEIEIAYNVEMAKRGGKGVYITGGADLPHRHVIKGEPIQFDAFGEYQHYHGDIGRTAVVGEPSEELRRRNKAMTVGWETAHEMFRDGVSSSQISRAILEAVRKAGFPGFLIAGPHSIGLEHTDHPIAIGPELPGQRGDLILRENMVINIDMPYHENGYGSLHLEDTVRITKNGCEPITSMRTELVVLPG